MKDQDILLENRRLIYDFILRNPGSHQRKIERDLNINAGTLRYHLRYMEKERIITTRKEKNLKVYFVAGKLGASKKTILSLLQQKRFRDIILSIINTPGSTHKEMADKLSLKPSTLSKYIRVLEERGVVRHERRGRERHLYIDNEREIMNLLLAYKPSFWDSAIDNMLHAYFER
jgi:predicted transcriptional regulator